MSSSAQHRWVLLIHQIPPKPDYFRVKVWRRLQRLGAVAIKNSVYALPYSDETVEDLQWQVREIVSGGGEASVCAATFVDGLTDAEVEALFRAARQTDYGEILADAKRLLRGHDRVQITAEVGRLKRRLSEVVAIDFFGAPNRQSALEAVQRVDASLRPAGARHTASEPASPVRVPRGATWVTRRHLYVDRIACAWLIHRFIDPGARFKFVAPEGYRPRRGEIRFDMFEAAYTHEGETCSFETLVARFAIADRGVGAIAQMVHDIDCKEAKFGRPETPGLERLLAGVAKRCGDDTARLKQGLALFDALHAGLADGAPEAGRASPAAARRSTRNRRSPRH